jgi:sporulation protein YlmC with PRC-barrel domain
MSGETFRSALGRKVVSRASAEDLGPVRHLIVDVDRKRVSGLVIGKGRKARVIDWEALTGFGPDAVIVIDEGAIREPSDDRENAALAGKLELVGRRALSERGNELGKIDDVVFDPATGKLEFLVVGDQEHPASALLGSGSYAAVLAEAAHLEKPSA